MYLKLLRNNFLDLDSYHISRSNDVVLDESSKYIKKEL